MRLRAFARKTTPHRTSERPPRQPEKGRFWTLGDANGLLLFLARGPRSVDPDRAYEFNIFKVDVTLRGSKRAEKRIAGYPHRITMNEK